MQSMKILVSVLTLSVLLIGCSKDQPVSSEKGRKDSEKSSAEVERQAGADVTSDGTALDLVPPDAAAAIVVNPRAIFTAPDVAEPWERFMAKVQAENTSTVQELGWLYAAGFDLRDFDQIVSVIQAVRSLPDQPADDEQLSDEASAAYQEIMEAGVFENAYILRFHQPVPQRAISGALFRPREVQFAGKTYYGSGRDAATFASHLVDERTVVFGEESVVRKVLMPQSGENPLVERLKQAGANQEIVAAMNLDVVRGRLSALAEPEAAALVQGLKTVTISADVGQRPSLSLSVTTNNPESAAQIEAVLRDQLEQVKQQLPPKEGLADVELPPQAKSVVKLGHKASESVKIEVRDNQVKLTLADVVDRGELFGLLDLVDVSQPEEGKLPPRQPPEDENETAAIIRRLATSAAGMANTDMRTLASSGGSPNPRSLNDQPLTLAILTEYVLDLNEKEYAERYEELQFSDADYTPDPSELVQSLTRSAWLGYCSMLQPDYITKTTCQVDGDQAGGVISFDAGMYSGRVQYKASRQDGDWRIDEFSFPVRDWRFVRTDDGTWHFLDHFGRLTEDRTLPEQEVTGVVTLGGEPLADCTVRFYLKDHPEFTRDTRAEADGTFSIKLLPGKHLVELRGGAPVLSPKGVLKLPDKYTRLSTTPLVVDVTKGATELKISVPE